MLKSWYESIRFDRKYKEWEKSRYPRVPTPPPSEPPLKCVIVGDPVVGKSSLMMNDIHLGYPYPSNDTDRNIELFVNEETITMNIWDIPAYDDYERLRPLYYTDKPAEVAVVCFSLVNPNSFESVYSKWHSELKHYCPNSPIVLVGLKQDLRNDTETLERLRNEFMAPLTFGDGYRLSRDIGAVTYIECSVKEHIGVSQVFEKAAWAAMYCV